MDAISAPIVTAIGAITAALITACFSYLNLIVSKEQKVSEFRQQWIDAFRKELSELTAAVFFIKYHYASHEHDHGPTEERSDLSKSLRESHEKHTLAVTSILLRINPLDPDQAQHIRNTIFLDTIKKYLNAFNDRKFDLAADLTKNLREAAMPLLEAGWDQVKRGEPSYRRTKHIAVAVMLLGLLGITWLAEDIIGLSATKPPHTVGAQKDPPHSAATPAAEPPKAQPQKTQPPHKH